MASVNVLRMNTVGPTTKRNSTRTAAATALALERNCTPFSMPVTAEITKQAVNTQITADGQERRSCRPRRTRCRGRR